MFNAIILQKLESLHSVNPSIPSGNRLYECSIVGCKFMASNQDELNYHIGEHEAIDEPLQTFLMDEVFFDNTVNISFAHFI